MTRIIWRTNAAEKCKFKWFSGESREGGFYQQLAPTPGYSLRVYMWPGEMSRDTHPRGSQGLMVVRKKNIIDLICVLKQKMVWQAVDIKLNLQKIASELYQGITKELTLESS